MHTFCENNKIELIVRGHEVVMSGYQFFAGGHLVTVFSATNYAGICNNDGALLEISASLFVTPKAGTTQQLTLQSGTELARVAWPSQPIRKSVWPSPRLALGSSRRMKKARWRTNWRKSQQPKPNQKKKSRSKLKRYRNLSRQKITVKRTKKAGPSSKRAKPQAPSAEPARRSSRNK